MTANDVVLINGSILTMDPAKPVATGLAIRGGRVAAVGTGQEARAASAPHARVIDLRGRTASPGLNDAHAHPMGLGLSMRDLNIANPPCSSVAEIVDLVRSRASQLPDGTWIVGAGYDQGRLAEGRHPTRHDLDVFSPNHPVLLIRACYHIAVANSVALSMAGIDRNTADPEGGSIDHDEHGEPTGVLRDTAYEVVELLRGEPSEDDLTDALIRAGKAYLETGVTSVAEAGIRRAEEMRAYQRLWRENRLPVRTYLMMIIQNTLDRLIELGISTGYGDDRLRIGPAKLFTDGSIGAHTARMRKPYEGTADTYGLWMQEPDVMKAEIKRAHAAGFQVGCHAIGDAAIDFLLGAYEEAIREHPRPGSRHRIEHCSIVDEAIVERIARLGAVPIPGTSFIYYFRNSYVTNLGLDRIRYTYGLATYNKHGVIAAASTDAPVVPVSATIGLQTMMTRLDINRDPVWTEESVSLEDALRAYTANGAYASFEESIKGSLAAGMLADVAIFETDLKAVEPGDIGAVKVDHTILNGELVYSRDGVD